MLNFIAIVLVLVILLCSTFSEVIVAPPCPGEPLAANIKAFVNGALIPLYPFPTSAVWPTRYNRTSGVGVFGQFDFGNEIVSLVVNPGVSIRDVVVKTFAGKPISFTPDISSDKSYFSFNISQPAQYYICINDDWANSLHIFANPLQSNPPNKTDNNVLLLLPGTYINISLAEYPGKTTIYLDVGQYFLESNTGYISLGLNEHLYMADGAFLYLSHHAKSSGIGMYGNFSTFTGRGVVDGSMQAGVASVDGFAISGNLLTIYTRTDLNQLLPGDNVSLALIPSPYSYLNSNSSFPHLTVLSSGLSTTQFQVLFHESRNESASGFYESMATYNFPQLAILAENPFAVVEGCILRDPAYFGVILLNQVTGNPLATNFKVLGRRLNTDGFHIDSIKNGMVSNAFIRTYDDAICVNNNNPTLSTSNFSVSNIMVFKQKAHAIHVELGVSEAMNGVVSGVYVIQDYSAEPVGTIAVGSSGTGTVGPNILISNITLDQCNSFVQLEINPTSYYSSSHQPGHVKGITFTNILSSSSCTISPLVSISGYNATNTIEDITFSRVVVGGVPLTASAITYLNPYYSNITVNSDELFRIQIN